MPSPPLGGVASGVSPVAVGCTGLTPGAAGVSGIDFANAEVEPFAAIYPGKPNLMLAAWQEDRWSKGGARGLVRAVSTDSGVSWTRTLHPFSRCGGAGGGTPGDFEGASDPWWTSSPTAP